MFLGAYAFMLFKQCEQRYGWQRICYGYNGFPPLSRYRVHDKRCNFESLPCGNMVPYRVKNLSVLYLKNCALISFRLISLNLLISLRLHVHVIHYIFY